MSRNSLRPLNWHPKKHYHVWEPLPMRLGAIFPKNLSSAWFFLKLCGSSAHYCQILWEHAALVTFLNDGITGWVKILIILEFLTWFYSLFVVPDRGLVGSLLQVFFCLDDSQEASPGKITVRLHNHPESLLALKLLKASYIGKFRHWASFL